MTAQFPVWIGGGQVERSAGKKRMNIKRQQQVTTKLSETTMNVRSFACVACVTANPSNAYNETVQINHEQVTGV